MEFSTEVKMGDWKLSKKEAKDVLRKALEILEDKGEDKDTYDVRISMPVEVKY